MRMRRLSGIGKTGETRKTTKIGKAATLALLTAALFGVATSDASAQERTLGVVAKNRVEAILVGVDEYASRNVETLTYAGADAKKLRDALTKIGVPEESVRLFVSRGGLRERPNKATIMAALDEAVKNSGPNSTILVALSGHGFETPDGEAAFCPEDAKISVSGVEVYVDKDSAILISEVAEKLRKDDAKFKLLIVDACRAPAGARTTNGRRSFVTGDASGLAFLQSCSSGESSWEDESVEGGLFTHYFVEGLTGAAADEEGGVSFLGVCDYAARRTKARARALRNASQTPFHRMSGTNFYLVEPSGTRSGGTGASAAELFTEAFQAFSAKDYATAKSKCEASLAASRTEAEKAAARNLLAMIEQAQQPQTPGTQTSTAQSQPQRPTSQPSQTQTASSSNATSDEESYPGDWSDAPKAGTRKTLEVDGIAYNFRYCPAGTFQMGSPESEMDRESDETQHRVTLDGFWMLETEVTVGMYRSFVKATNYKMGPGYDGKGGWGYDSSGSSGQSLNYTWENPGFSFGFQQTDAHPVTQVDWEGAKAFCDWLARESGLPIRLPSEAEWEYACRAGSTTAYSFGSDGEDLTEYGNVADASVKRKFPNWTTVSSEDGYVFTAPVKTFKPNEWNLYDMHGNVWEWCADWYDADYYKTKNSAQGLINETPGSYRVLRGGGWSYSARYCRSAYRRINVPAYRRDSYGFRLVLGR